MSPAPSLALVNASGDVLHSEGGELPIYSIAKTYTAAAVLQSDIDLTTRVSHWFTPETLPRAEHITVRQLLQHTSGLRDYAGPDTAYVKAVSAKEPPWSDAQFIEHTLKQPLLFSPGSAFSYANPGYWLLKQILEKEHDASYAEVLTQMFLSPLSLSHTRIEHGVFAEDLPDYPAEWVWPGVIVATAADTARFMASSSVARLAHSLVEVPPHPLWQHPHYGYGLMVEPGDRYGHNGGGPGYTASCFHYTQHGLTGCALIPEASEEHTMQAVLDLVTEYRDQL